MNVVDFAEGILGGTEHSPRVAACLRLASSVEYIETQFKISDVARDLERGNRIQIERLREIGEGPLSLAQRLFLNAEKEKSSS